MSKLRQSLELQLGLEGLGRIESEILRKNSYFQKRTKKSIPADPGNFYTTQSGIIVFKVNLGAQTTKKSQKF